MHVGVLTLELAIYDAFSLKDKRNAIKSLKDRIRRQFNVSVAEVEHMESRRRATVAVVMVSSDATRVESCLDKITAFTERHPAVTLVDFDKEML